ncbi:unnamed protein product [Miscanthus lutarioriparius]|uniref:Aconitate hydratase n=1 Tax=Miscanthus lutarioriparius TaxID=422564 RepID=A0A811MVS1_9POAL|nr:unnamed protein product [Miscanthus lutarioriparius]
MAQLAYFQSSSIERKMALIMVCNYISTLYLVALSWFLLSKYHGWDRFSGPHCIFPVNPICFRKLTISERYLFAVPKEQQDKVVKFDFHGQPAEIKHGSVVIAAITSCTNTSIPSVMLGAGLVAKKAYELGLEVKPWVKTSLATRSGVVTKYLLQSGLQEYLNQQGFHTVGYGCTTCIGNSVFIYNFGTILYGRRASQLLKEIDSSEAGQLAPFNTDVFDQVIRECSEHNSQFQSLIRKMVEQNLDIETTRNEDHYGAAIHHRSLLCNKRCLMAYMYNRAEVIQSFRWKVGPVLPHDIQEKLHFSEKEYFKNHSAAIKSYISEMDIDLTVDKVPPKDPYIQVRVLEDIGEVSLGDHSVSLTKNSLHFLRRTDAEQFISQDVWRFFSSVLLPDGISPL